MSESSENTENREALPAVFQMDLSKREGFLSQIGSFTQEQRRIFHRICDFYDPNLDYNRFVLHAGKDILFANNQIEVLMKKIRTAHYGLLKFQLLEGELKPNRIVLCDRDSIAFYNSVIEDETQRLLLEESRPFLTREELEEQNLAVPPEFIDDIGPENLSPGFIRGGEKSGKIYTIHLKTGVTLLTSSGAMPYLINLSQNKIASHLHHTSFLTIVSRFMDIKISEIQKKLRTREPGFWYGIATKVLQNREDLQLRLKHLEPSLFQSCEILFHYFKNSVAEEENERKENAAKEAALDEVCMEILRKDNFLVSPDELDRMMKPHVKRWDNFKDLFFEKSAKTGAKIGLPVVLIVNGHYLHRDHVYPYFRSELTMQSRELRAHYIQMMERMLRTGNKDRITTFYTRDTFKDDILDMLANDAPVLSEFLGKPRIISEGIVHYFKNLKKVRDVNKIKEFMNNFFDQGVIKFKDPDYLLDLYLLDIFEEAYKFLSWWKKLILRLSGKKDGFTSQFSGLGEKGAVASVTGIPRPDEAGTRDKVLSSRPSENSYQGRKNDTAATAYRRRKRSAEPTSKGYNLKQRNRAWSEFEDAFHRKNG
ncbi:MAG: hypothetical protein PQJ50_15540 [Spirochaetales bacterium]|nr:hypothetical protein [Spirochaetales bacterium]